MPLHQATSPELRLDDHPWGLLVPLDRCGSQHVFKNTTATCTIGRYETNDIVFPWEHISNYHCVISWDGLRTHQSKITVVDLSLNGTYINGIKIGKNRCALLQEGNEIAFGVCDTEDDHMKYRYEFQNLAANRRFSGLKEEYEIIGEIGKGGFATVLKARHMIENVVYAIKCIRRENLNEFKSIDGSCYFESEIEIMEKLIHPNICRLKEVFYERHQICLVMELVAGGDLSKYVRDHRPMSELEVQRITFQICDAVAYIHAMGVVHRDLKPENILMTASNPSMVKVADFGLSRVIDNVTLLHTFCGTPWYLAPEVVDQHVYEGYDHAVDSWSIGVIVFTMLTNRRPFKLGRGLNVVTWIGTRRVQWDVLRDAGVGLQARLFVHRLLKIDPKRRMTPNNARFHAWLSEQALVCGISEYAA